MTDNQKKIGERVITELKEALESINAEDSLLGIEEVDEDAMTITIKFRFLRVEKENYIGLSDF
jgi:hypothetical protein